MGFSERGKPFVSTLSLTFRASRILSQPAIHDWLLLIVISILSLSNYIFGLGFYEDDWPFLAAMSLSPDQSLAGVFTPFLSWDKVICPVYFFPVAVPYKLFGLNPLGFIYSTASFSLLDLYCFILVSSRCVNHASYPSPFPSFIPAERAYADHCLAKKYPLGPTKGLRPAFYTNLSYGCNRGQRCGR